MGRLLNLKSRKRRGTNYKLKLDNKRIKKTQPVDTGKYENSTNSSRKETHDHINQNFEFLQNQVSDSEQQATIEDSYIEQCLFFNEDLLRTRCECKLLPDVELENLVHFETIYDANYEVQIPVIVKTCHGETVYFPNNQVELNKTTVEEFIKMNVAFQNGNVGSYKTTEGDRKPKKRPRVNWAGLNFDDK